MFKYFEVTTDSSIAEINTQYKNLAKKYHPDIATGYSSKEKFQEIQNEYEKALQYLKHDNDMLNNNSSDDETAQIIDLFSKEVKINVKYQPLVKAGLEIFFKLMK